MVAINKLQKAPPYPVERTLKKLGKNLRRARRLRHLTINEAAERIGTGPRAVMDAEKGKASTGIVVYVALLWLYDLLYQFEELATPETDKQNPLAQLSEEPTRVRKRRGIKNDF